MDMEAAVATKFVKWEVPTLESLHECKVYRLRMKVNNGEVWGIERSGFFNGREKWAKGFENQRV